MPDFRAKLLLAAAAAALLAAPLSGPALAAPDIDTAVRPGDDFYRYANGGWLARTSIPQGRSAYDTGSMLRDETATRVRDLIQAAAQGTWAAPTATDRSLAQKVGAYYASLTDAAAIESKGLAPLSDELTAIAAIADRKGLAVYLGRTLHPDDGTNSQTEGVLGAWIHQGFRQADHYAPHLVQGGLGLPDRDDYLDPGAEKAGRRALYQAHVAAVLGLAGLDQPQARAERVVALEVAIATTHAPPDDAADAVFKTDNPWRRADFDAKAPGLDWGAYFKAAGLGAQADFVVWQPSAVVGAAALAGSQPLEAWRDYLAFHLVEHYAAALPRAFGDENTAFAGKLSGAAPQTPDRNAQAIAATNAALGEAVGRLYVERDFPPQAKAAAVAMVEAIRTAYRARLASLTWMSPQTRVKAQAKLAALQVGLGYPDSWIDYSGLAVVRGDAVGNLRRADAFTWRRELAKLRQPVDPAEWPEPLLQPQMVGALINFTPNALQFAAGLLQPPYFDFAGDAAANYGSAGAGIGHEITHSFDELGNLYDAQGLLVRWWTPADLTRFQAATAPMTAQLDAYCPKPGLCVKGKQVLRESTDDLAGLTVAHDAYVLSLNGKPDVVKDGLTGDQRFFLAFARRWRRQQGDAALIKQLATDTHAPGEVRSDTVRNLEDWYRAFDVQPGDKLYLKPQARVRIW